MKNGLGSASSPRSSPLTRARHFVDYDLWHAEASSMGRLKSGLYRLGRVVVLAVQGLKENQAFLQAAALTYIMVLSLVPFLALGFSVAKGLGAYESLQEKTIQPFLDHAFPPSAEGGTAEAGGTREAIEKVLDFVAKTDFNKVGVIGLLFLLFAAQKLLNNVEQAFNRIWGVRQSRSFVRRVTDYTALMVVTPILLIAATGATAALESNAVVDWVSRLPILGGALAYIAPVVFLWIGFTFLYVCMPNCKVPLSSAFIGGVFGGTLWQIFQVLHVNFQVGVAGYNKLYSGFAAFPIFLAWLYVSFVIMLLGALVAWAHQVEPTQRLMRRTQLKSDADREIVALRAVRAIAAHFARGEGVMDGEELAGRLGVPLLRLNEVLDPLMEAKVLAATADEPRIGFVMARPLETTRLLDVILAMRGERSPIDPDAAPIAALIDRVHAEADGVSANLTLREIVDNDSSER